VFFSLKSIDPLQLTSKDSLFALTRVKLDVLEDIKLLLATSFFLLGLQLGANPHVRSFVISEGWSFGFL
jgi:hypothetical protein